jgi:hypothetical protein
MPSGQGTERYRSPHATERLGGSVPGRPAASLTGYPAAHVAAQPAGAGRVAGHRARRMWAGRLVGVEGLRYLTSWSIMPAKQAPRGRRRWATPND